MYKTLEYIFEIKSSRNFGSHVKPMVVCLFVCLKMCICQK